MHIVFFDSNKILKVKFRSWWDLNVSTSQMQNVTSEKNHLIQNFDQLPVLDLAMFQKGK